MAQRANPDVRERTGIALDDTGGDERPPLVFLHGLTFARGMWAPVVDAVRQTDPQRRVITVDLPGHGESSPIASYALDDVANAIEHALDAASVETPVLVGHSVSGVISTLYAALHPVVGVVNVDQAIDVRGFATLVRSIEPQLTGPDFATVWPMIESSFHTERLSPEMQELVRATSRVRQEVVVGYWKVLFDQPIEETEALAETALAEIRRRELPYLFVAGEAVDPAYAEWLHARLPQARTEIYPGSGHFPQLARPADFAAELAATASWAR